MDDKGSSPQCARVLVQGVPADGIVDSGAEITIMGAELFKRVASVVDSERETLRNPTGFHVRMTKKCFLLMESYPWTSHLGKPQ